MVQLALVYVKRTGSFPWCLSGKIKDITIKTGTVLLFYFL